MPDTSNVVQPFDPLLNDPPGDYGLTPYGRSSAVSLTGSPQFRERAFNLFSTFGTQVRQTRWLEHRPLIARVSDRPDTVWFSLPPDRVREALRLYFYGQLWKQRARDVVDDEGDFVECVCDTEDALWDECDMLARQFIVEHMRPDSGAIPACDWECAAVVEHCLGVLGQDADWS